MSFINNLLKLIFNKKALNGENETASKSIFQLETQNALHEQSSDQNYSNSLKKTTKTVYTPDLLQSQACSKTITVNFNEIKDSIEAELRVMTSLIQCSALFK